ncbi:hypothetical protein [Lactococcus petauri]|uniref:Response regulator n=1 Tax=Lactococcus petauri TaxID=1940789 RepID=A0A252CBH0_9LACT|nr:hypothetical protein [Lactococcus petauri]OUK03875.1 hypothetical protein BZZ03_09500 [Lactococcus petauri]
MKNTISIVYIDDKRDNILSRYIATFSDGEFEFISTEIHFTDKYTNFELLLEEEALKTSDIVIIDSKLFEDGDVTEKFSGEEFKLIYTTAHPYSKIFVITQNEGLEKFGTIKKYDTRLSDSKTSTEYYDEVLGEKIKIASDEILQKRRILEQLKGNSEFYKDSLVVDKIDELMEGSSSYKDLTDDKIDELILLIEDTIKPKLEK